MCFLAHNCMYCVSARMGVRMHSVFLYFHHTHSQAKAKRIAKAKAEAERIAKATLEQLPESGHHGVASMSSHCMLSFCPYWFLVSLLILFLGVRFIFN